MRLPKTALAALPLALLSLAAANPVHAATTASSTATRQLYVSPAGNDHNAGTKAHPFRQVNRAAAVATPGTLVHVAPGTYGAVTSTRSGTSTAPIRFLSDSKWTATISAPGQTSAWTNTAQWIVIQNFAITRAQYNGIVTSTSNGRFLGNHIHHLAPPNCSRGGGGIVAENYTATNNDSIGNYIDHIHVSGDCARIHGIYYQSPHAGRILNNLVTDTSGWGIHLWHNANTITIANNTVLRNLKGGIVVGGSLEGNDVAPGIARGVVVTNNIVADNGDFGIREMGRVGKNTYANNLLFRNHAGAFSLNGGGVPTGTVTGDPRFVNPARADYRLRIGSPAVNRGTTLGAPRYDRQLAPRPQAGRMDIGAYEGAH
jgi:parallel beta-helix repeat protein